MTSRYCSKRGCGEIMCQWYSDRFGYLCYECLSELKSLGSVLSEEEVNEWLKVDKHRKDEIHVETEWSHV